MFMKMAKAIMKNIVTKRISLRAPYLLGFSCSPKKCLKNTVCRPLELLIFLKISKKIISNLYKR